MKLRLLKPDIVPIHLFSTIDQLIHWQRHPRNVGPHILVSSNTVGDFPINAICNSDGNTLYSRMLVTPRIHSKYGEYMGWGILLPDDARASYIKVLYV